jgi:hypothetical protein
LVIEARCDIRFKSDQQIGNLERRKRRVALVHTGWVECEEFVHFAIQGDGDDVPPTDLLCNGFSIDHLFAHPCERRNRCDGERRGETGPSQKREKAAPMHVDA